jgi:triosephosphate isomerase
MVSIIFSKFKDVVVAPVSMHLGLVQETLNKNIQVSAQNVSLTGTGAFTGEISCAHLKDYQIGWAIVGHSERRALYGETNQAVGQKTKYAIDNNVSTITCIGETLAERESGATFEIVSSQLEAVRSVLDTQDWERVVIAYEPVWAIGTGKVATPEIAQEVHAHIRRWLAEKVSQEVSNATRVIYGGNFL